MGTVECVIRLFFRPEDTLRAAVVNDYQRIILLVKFFTSDTHFLSQSDLTLTRTTTSFHRNYSVISKLDSGYEINNIFKASKNERITMVFKKNKTVQRYQRCQNYLSFETSCHKEKKKH